METNISNINSKDSEVPKISKDCAINQIQADEANSEILELDTEININTENDNSREEFLEAQTDELNVIEDIPEEIETNNEDKKGNLPKINKRALPKDAETYMLETFKENKMIIFNHEFVDGYAQRKGTDKDVEALENTFSKFGFKIETYKDKYRIEVGQIMKDFSTQDFTNCGCVAIAILTHGSDRGGLRARDHKYREQQILEYIKKNATMATKPIIYILQACRGGRLQELKAIYAKKDNVQYVAQYRLPEDSDTILLHSTFKDKYSYRSEDSGSWFIQTLCKKINALADIEDFESILVSVRREVAIYKENKIKNMKTNKYDYNKQMPVTETTLIRKLYLKRNEELLSIQEPIFDDNEDIINNEGDEEMQRNIYADYIDCEICPKVNLERFDYVLKCLTQYIADNPKDSKANTLLVVAKPCMYSNDDKAKIEMAKLIRDFFSTKSSHEKYKFFYVWNDFEED